MKAWLAMLLVGIGACADPPRRPPVTYVPIVRGPEAPASTTPGAATGGSTPSEKEGTTTTSLVAVSTEAPPPDDLCVKKAANGCCGESGVTPKKQGAKTVCPAGTVLRAKCKSGASCKH